MTGSVEQVAPTAPIQGLGGFEIAAVEFAEVDLEKDADTIGPAAMGTDGIDAVAVIDGDFPAVRG